MHSKGHLSNKCMIKVLLERATREVLEEQFRMIFGNTLAAKTVKKINATMQIISIPRTHSLLQK